MSNAVLSASLASTRHSDSLSRPRVVLTSRRGRNLPRLPSAPTRALSDTYTDSGRRRPVGTRVIVPAHARVGVNSAAASVRVGATVKHPSSGRGEPRPSSATASASSVFSRKPVGTQRRDVAKSCLPSRGRGAGYRGRRGVGTRATCSRNGRVTFSDQLSQPRVPADGRGGDISAEGQPSETPLSAACSSASSSSSSTSCDAAGRMCENHADTMMIKELQTRGDLLRSRLADLMTQSGVTTPHPLSQSSLTPANDGIHSPTLSVTPPDSEMDVQMSGIAAILNKRRQRVHRSERDCREVNGECGDDDDDGRARHDDGVDAACRVSVGDTCARSASNINMPNTRSSCGNLAGDAFSCVSPDNKSRAHVGASSSSLGSNRVSPLWLLQEATMLRLTIVSVSFRRSFVETAVSSCEARGHVQLCLQYFLPLDGSVSDSRRSHGRVTGHKLTSDMPMNHRCVVPVAITAAGLRYWRVAELQLVAEAHLTPSGGDNSNCVHRQWTLAVGSVPMKRLLRAPRLCLSVQVPLSLRSHHSAAGASVSGQVGHVSVILRLTSDRAEFTSALHELWPSSTAVAPAALSCCSSTSSSSSTSTTVSSCSENGVVRTVSAGDKANSSQARRDSTVSSRPARDQHDDVGHTSSSSSSPSSQSDCLLHHSNNNQSVRLLWRVQVGGAVSTAARGRHCLAGTWLVLRAPWLPAGAPTPRHHVWTPIRPRYNLVSCVEMSVGRNSISRLRKQMLIIEVWQQQRDRPDLAVTSSGDVTTRGRLVGIARVSLSASRCYAQLTSSSGDLSSLLYNKEAAVVLCQLAPVIDPCDGDCVAQLEVSVCVGTAEQLARVTRHAPLCHDHSLTTQQTMSALVGARYRVTLSLARVLHVPDINEQVASEPLQCWLRFCWPVQHHTVDGAVEWTMQWRDSVPVTARVNPRLAHSAQFEYEAIGGAIGDHLTDTCAEHAGVRCHVIVRRTNQRRHSLVAQGVLSSLRITSLLAAVDCDPSETSVSSTFSVPLFLTSPPQGEPARPCLEVTLTVDRVTPLISSSTRAASRNVHIDRPTSELLQPFSGLLQPHQHSLHTRHHNHYHLPASHNLLPDKLLTERASRSAISSCLSGRVVVTRTTGDGRTVRFADDSDSESSDSGGDTEHISRADVSGISRLASNNRCTDGGSEWPCAGDEDDNEVGQHDDDYDDDLCDRQPIVLTSRRGQVGNNTNTGHNHSKNAGDAGVSARALSPLPEQLEEEHEEPVERESSQLQGSSLTIHSDSASVSCGQRVDIDCAADFSSSDVLRQIEEDLRQMSTAGSLNVASTVTSISASADRRSGSGSGGDVGIHSQPQPADACRTDADCTYKSTAVASGGNLTRPVQPTVPLSGVTWRAQLTVLEALNVSHVLTAGNVCPPRVYVAVETESGVRRSQCGGLTATPRWNWACTLTLSSQLLLQDFHYLVLKVWHHHSREPAAARSAADGATMVDQVLGVVLVDLTPLLHGLDELAGWYNIVDLSGLNRGQLRLSLRPLDDLGSMVRRPDACVNGGVQSWALIADCATATMTSHLVRHAADVTVSMAAAVSSQTACVPAPMAASATTITASQQPAGGRPAAVCRSESMEALTSVLHKNLCELDDIRKCLLDKLASPHKSPPVAASCGGGVLVADGEWRRLRGVPEGAHNELAISLSSGLSNNSSTN